MSENPLKKVEYFNEVREEILDELYAHGTITTFKKGSTILFPKTENQPICILLEGVCFRYNLTHAKNRKILFIFGTNTILNDSIYSSDQSNNYCDAKTKAKVLMISRDIFLNCMQKDFNLVTAAFKTTDKQIWRLSHQLKNTVGSMTIERKLASKLWKLGRDFGEPSGDYTDIKLDLSITFLADMLGVPRESASRACKIMMENNVIKIDKKHISINSNKARMFYTTGKFE